MNINKIAHNAEQWTDRFVTIVVFPFLSIFMTGYILFIIISTSYEVFNVKNNPEIHCSDIIPCPKCRKIDTANYVPVMYESEKKWRRICMACGYSGKAHTTAEQADEEWAMEYDYNVMMERIEKRKREALENLEKSYGRKV